MRPEFTLKSALAFKSPIKLTGLDNNRLFPEESHVYILYQYLLHNRRFTGGRPDGLAVKLIVRRQEQRPVPSAPRSPASPSRGVAAGDF